jgi:hypothetical protein
MTGIDVKYEAERWELLSRCASLCAEEASRVAQSLAQAQPREDGRWLVPPGTHRDARRAMSSAAVLFKVARELDYREPYTTDKG